MREATPVTHPAVLGPPPSAPQMHASLPSDRYARRRQLAQTLRQSREQPGDPPKPGTASQRRFWADVGVKERPDGRGWEVHLDTRPVRTASRQVLVVPKRKKALATSIAIEWDNLTSAQQARQEHHIPLTSLVSRALDVQAADQGEGFDNPVRSAIVETAMRYFSTDTLLCWAPARNPHDPSLPKGVKPLRERQREVAEPIIGYLTSHVFPGVELGPILDDTSIMPTPPPATSAHIIKSWVAGLPAFELAALERGVLGSKSLLVATRLVVEWSTEFSHLRSSANPRFGIEEAAQAASLEVLHQTEQWGEVEDTHDVEKEDLRRQLGSAVLLVG